MQASFCVSCISGVPEGHKMVQESLFSCVLCLYWCSSHHPAWILSYCLWSALDLLASCLWLLLGSPVHLFGLRLGQTKCQKFCLPNAVCIWMWLL